MKMRQDQVGDLVKIHTCAPQVKQWIPHTIHHDGSIPFLDDQVRIVVMIVCDGMCGA